VADAKYFPIPALCPKTGGQKVIKLTDDTVKKIRTYGPAVRMYDIIGEKGKDGSRSPVQEILLHPYQVFEHIREHQVGGSCYCGVPSCAFTNGGNITPPHPGKVYCVYVNPADMYFESGWEPADPDDPCLPLGWQARYKERIWPKP
jgi:hypothetical protein